jgi:hypothetical protein
MLAFTLKMAQDNCQAGDKTSCDKYANAYTIFVRNTDDHQQTPSEWATAQKFNRQACDLGAGMGCYRLAKLHEQRGQTQQALSFLQKTVPLLEADCPTDTAACTTLGDFYRKGIAVPKNWDTALSWYAKSDEVYAKWIANLEKQGADCGEDTPSSCGALLALRIAQRVNQTFPRHTHWANMQYDAETMSGPVPPEILIGQWTMAKVVTPVDPNLDPPPKGIAEIVELNPDGTAIFHELFCNREKRTVEAGTVIRNRYHLDREGKRLVIADGTPARLVFSIEFVGTEELILRPETGFAQDQGPSVPIHYRRTHDLQTRCAEYFDKLANDD